MEIWTHEKEDNIFVSDANSKIMFQEEVGIVNNVWMSFQHVHPAQGQALAHKGLGPYILPLKTSHLPTSTQGQNGCKQPPAHRGLSYNPNFHVNSPSAIWSATQLVTRQQQKAAGPFARVKLANATKQQQVSNKYCADWCWKIITSSEGLLI